MTQQDARILIVEDEQKLAKVLEEFLQHSGYETHIIYRGDEVVGWLKQQQADLMLLDIMLPGKDGLDVCREVRQFSNIPIIMTTARIEEIDRLLGLELGADDYISKPYSVREVVARVKAHLRRAAMYQQDTPITSQSAIRLDSDRLKVIHQENEAALTAVEFKLFDIMFQHPGRIYSRDQLMDLIYSDRRVVSDRTIDSHIKKLRKKLTDIAPDLELIHSVYGAGYRYEE